MVVSPFLFSITQTIIIRARIFCMSCLSFGVIFMQPKGREIPVMNFLFCGKDSRAENKRKQRNSNDAVAQRSFRNCVLSLLLRCMNHVEEEDLRVLFTCSSPGFYSFFWFLTCMSLLVSSCFCALLFLQTFFSLCVHIFTWSLCIQFVFVSVVCFRVILCLCLSSSFPLTMQC